MWILGVSGHYRILGFRSFGALEFRNPRVLGILRSEVRVLESGLQSQGYRGYGSFCLEPVSEPGMNSED